MKEGQSVYANRQIGKNGIPKRTKGTIESFSDDKNDWYWFPVDEL